MREARYHNEVDNRIVQPAPCGGGTAGRSTRDRNVTYDGLREGR